MSKGSEAVVVGVKDHSREFLKYLDKIDLRLGAKVRVVEIIEYDGSAEIEGPDGSNIHISSQVIPNIVVK